MAIMPPLYRTLFDLYNRKTGGGENWEQELKTQPGRTCPAQSARRDLHSCQVDGNHPY